VSDFVEITPLGSGREVGRSCHLIKFKDKQILLDCGIHPAHRGAAAMPFFDAVDLEKIDLLLLTHFHLDHAACLPYFLEKTRFRGRVFCTHPTKSIYKLILQDYVRVSNLSDNALYTEKELTASMPKIETLQYHTTRTVNGIKFSCYAAGHVLGAAMFLIEIAGVRILYTGDYSRVEDRHLMQAEIPPVCPDILIMEATFGTQNLPPIKKREDRLTEALHKTVRNGGRVLIPVFALGRAQELLLIVDEYWQQNKDLQHIPVYYAGVLAKKCIAVYHTFSNMMSMRMQDQISVENPFDFKYVRNLKSKDHFEDSGPCVVFASPGMLQSGFSRELFESWCNEPRNCLIVAGYSVQGTMAKHVLTNPSEIESLAGMSLPLKMRVHYIRFAAHADFNQHREFIAALRPQHIILVHGESTEMQRFQDQIERLYEGTQLRVTGPSNCQKVEIEIRRNKIVKTLGTLAGAEAPKDGDVLRGLLVRKDFNHLLLAPDDLAEFTSVTLNHVANELTIDFNSNQFDALKMFLSRVYDVKDSGAGTGKKKRRLKVMDVVTLYTTGQAPKSQLVLSWTGGPTNDMIADSVISLVSNMQSNASPAVARALQNGQKCNHLYEDPMQNYEYIMQEHFGDKAKFENKFLCVVNTDSSSARIQFEIKPAKKGRRERIAAKVESSDGDLKKRIQRILGYVEGALFPLTWQEGQRKRKKPRVKEKPAAFVDLDHEAKKDQPPAKLVHEPPKEEDKKMETDG